MSWHGYLLGNDETVAALDQYTITIEQCVRDTEKILNRALAMGIWTDSKSLAKLLL